MKNWIEVTFFTIEMILAGACVGFTISRQYDATQFALNAYLLFSISEIRWKMLERKE